MDAPRAKTTGRVRQAGRPLGRPVASDADERRRLIIDVARRHFAERGYVGTTNRGIADDAGITTGAIYYYFGSKKELYLAVFEEVDHRILERYKTALCDPAMSFNDGIVGLLEVSSQMNREDQALATFLARASFDAYRSPELLVSYRQHDRKMVQFFDHLVDQGIKEGRLDPDTDRDEILDAIRVLTLGLTWFGIRIQDPDAHRRATHATIRMLRGELVRTPKASRKKDQVG